MTLFERLRDQQYAVAKIRIPVGSGDAPAPGAEDDGLLSVAGELRTANILMRPRIRGFAPVPAEQMRRLTRGYIVIAPRFRIYCRHTGGYSGNLAHVLDDSTLVHVPASQEHGDDEVDTLLPADWQTHFPLLAESGADPLNYLGFIPAYTQYPCWGGFTYGWPYVHTANIIGRERRLFTPTVLKGRIIAPRADDPRRPHCTPSTFPKGSTTDYNIFNGQGSATPIWMLVQEPGNAHSTMVRIGFVSWNGGYFEWWHAGITNFRGRGEVAKESRTMTQIMNDLAMAAGDDHMAGLYHWPGILKTVNLGRTRTFSYDITIRRATLRFPPGTVAGGWRIEVFDRNGALVAETTNPEGRFFARLAPGDYRVTAARLDVRGNVLDPAAGTAHGVAVEVPESIVITVT